jgi:N-terminal 7TM region of histidine kinase
VSAQAGARRTRLATPRTASFLAAGVVVLIAALPVAGVLTGQTHRIDASTLKTVSGLLVVVLVVGAVGLVVARHQPGNPIGWLLLATANWIPLTIVAGSYATYVYHSGHRAIPLLSPAALILGEGFTLVIAVFPMVTLLFPDGRLPSRGWRWVVGVYLALCLSVPVSVAVAVAMAGHRLVVQADGSVTGAGNPPSWMGLVFFATVVLAWLGALGHQIRSWRRSSGERRQQLKWLLSGTVACAVLGIWAVATNSAIWEIAIVGLAALPVGIGIGILKYRLYDIDRIISRTLAYAVITGLLVGVYAGLVLLATQVLGFASTWAVAASTLAAAALFTPVRRRVQRVVDRRFNRARYDADAAVAAFAARLSGAVALDEVRADLLASVAGALEPAHVTVWISGGGR